MKRITGFLAAAAAAIVIGTASLSSAQAAPVMTGTGTVVLESTPQTVEDVRWRGGGRRFVGHRFGGPRFHRGARFHRPYYGHRYRPYRPVYVRPAYHGPRCFWRPARTVWTHYGWRFRPAARICRW
jgi:hypothetical protein